MEKFLSSSIALALYAVSPLKASETMNVIEGLKKHAFIPIDDVSAVESLGWVSFDDADDVRFATPDKGAYLCFSLRIDTRKVSSKIVSQQLKKNIREEHEKNGGKYVSRERRKELKEMLVARLLQKVMPEPVISPIIWDWQAGMLYVCATSQKVLRLFEEKFRKTFEYEIERITPASQGLKFVEENNLLTLQPENICGGLAGNSVEEFLGKEFLTWLWEKADTSYSWDGLQAGMEGKVVIEGGTTENALETISMTGVVSLLDEARMGIGRGKFVKSGNFSFEKNGEPIFRAVLNGGNFSLSSLKTPPVKLDRDADEDAAFLAKMSFIQEGCACLLDTIYADFIRRRCDERLWGDEAKRIQNWAKQ